jgi:XTP/dITP diphosphohydrolase
VGRLSLLVTSPRVAPGLLTRSAWYAVESASARLCRDVSEPVVDAIVESGLEVDPVGPELSAPDLARLLVDRSSGADVVWLGSSDADPGLTDAIASEVSRLEEPPEVEVIVGSWDVPGSRLLDAVAVMDRLRSPGGCPWDAEQTHESLAKYLTEEAAEAVEAIESGDRRHLAEELGDVLLQVLFHSRVAEDAPAPGDQFDIDEVAGVLVAKLVRRHPHVFADAQASTPEEVEEAWARIKAEEKAEEKAGEQAEEQAR